MRHNSQQQMLPLVLMVSILALTVDGLESAEDGGQLTDPDPTSTTATVFSPTVCTIRVQKVEKLHGKCVQVKGSINACTTDQFLDPTNEDCEDEITKSTSFENNA